VPQGEFSETEPACPQDPSEEIAEAEYRSYLVDRALQLMKTDFEPTTWQACWSYVAEGRPATEVASELGISVNAVHLAKARVLRRLRRELEGLLD
jgi:RNA polymerase sigma-70 factor (ECF subfamily)